MVCNLGKSDRIFRAMFGIALFVSGILVGGTAGTVMGFVGLIPLVTAAVGNCPAYTVLKINTRNVHNE